MAERVRKTADGDDPTLTLLRAQVAYQLLKGSTMADLMVWFRKNYPLETLDLLYAAVDEAEVQAKRAQRYRELRASGKPFCMKDCLGE